MRYNTFHQGSEIKLHQIWHRGLTISDRDIALLTAYTIIKMRLSVRNIETKCRESLCRVTFLFLATYSFVFEIRGAIMASNSIHTQCTHVYKTPSPHLEYSKHPISQMLYSSTSEWFSHSLDTNVNIALYLVSLYLKFNFFLDCFASRPDVLTHHIWRPTIFTYSNPSCHLNYP